jgi:DNA polymerase-3 subunit epsilon
MRPKLKGDTVIFDTETTGLPLHSRAPLSQQPRIIEFGAIRLNPKGEMVMECSILIQPGCSLSPEITKITGLTDADLVGAPRFAEALPQIELMFEGAEMVIAHNLPFDRALLGFDLKRAGAATFPWPRRELCTVSLYRDFWGRDPRLIEVYEWVMGKPYPQTHRALDDTRALAEVVVKDKLLVQPPPEWKVSPMGDWLCQ